VRLVVVDRDPDRPLLVQQRAQQFEPVAHQRQPLRVLDAIVIVGKGAAGVVRGVDEDALHLAGVLLLQGLQGQQVVALDQQVVVGGRRAAGVLVVQQVTLCRATWRRAV